MSDDNGLGQDKSKRTQVIVVSVVTALAVVVAFTIVRTANTGTDLQWARDKDLANSMTRTVSTARQRSSIGKRSLKSIQKTNSTRICTMTSVPFSINVGG